MAEIDAPPSSRPPPRSSSTSDMSGGGLAKAAGGCCVTFCLCVFAISFLLVGMTAFYYPSIGFMFTGIGLLLLCAGLAAARWEWGVLKGSSG
ncbi:MAG: hypothetical protein ACFFF9_03880 [Candidatus Thorarchaeota archaeon]